MSELKIKIQALTEAFLEGSDYYVVDIKHTPASNKLQVFLDSDSSVTVDRCAKISRHIEKTLDEEKWIGEQYILEVSSAGMDSPLKNPRQYAKYKGREIEVLYNDGRKIEGILQEADEDKIKLLKEKKLKNKNIPDGEEIISFTDIKTVKRIINF